MIIGIEGVLGKGKTLALTAFGLIYYLCGYRILSNYHVEFNHTKVITASDLIIEKTTSPICFLADELWNSADSRKSMSNKNLLISNILLASRKRSFTVLYSQQSHNQIDKRIRQITNYWLYPIIDEMNQLLYVHMYNKQGFVTTFTFNALMIYNLFDTDEVVSYEDLETHIIIKENEKYLQKLNEYFNKNSKLSDKSIQYIQSMLYKDNFKNVKLNRLIIEEIKEVE